jgi:hypothetical protein
MSNFVVRLVMSPRPWPFRWGPWGRSSRDVTFEMDDGQVLIWQRSRKGLDIMVDVPMAVDCITQPSACTTMVVWAGQSVRRRTRR